MSKMIHFLVFSADEYGRSLGKEPFMMKSYAKADMPKSWHDRNEKIRKEIFEEVGTGFFSVSEVTTRELQDECEQAYKAAARANLRWLKALAAEDSA